MNTSTLNRQLTRHSAGMTHVPVPPLWTPDPTGTALRLPARSSLRAYLSILVAQVAVLAVIVLLGAALHSSGLDEPGPTPSPTPQSVPTPR